jgi:hypothetical protein
MDADVARSDQEGQGRRPRRHRDVRLLERPRAAPPPGSNDNYFQLEQLMSYNIINMPLIRSFVRKYL